MTNPYSDIKHEPDSFADNQEAIGRFLFGDNYEQMQMDLLKAYIEALDEYIKEFKERIIAEIEKQEANK